MLHLLMTALAQPIVLSTELQGVAVQVQELQPATCETVLQSVFDELRQVTPADVDPIDVQQNSAAMAAQIFAIRIEAQAKIKQFHADDTLTEGCVRGLRRADLASRYLLDHLYEAEPTLDPWLTSKHFHGLTDLRSGDILVTRGTSLGAAGIAHIGRLDSQFSHNAMIYVDPKGEVWTIEAYLEKGAVVQPLHDFINHGLGRIVVMRNPDPVLAERAAFLAYDRIKNGDPIDYDEGFVRDDDGEQLFCSEIGPWAFGHAGGPTDLPLYPTVFPRDKNARLFDMMGIKVDMTAAPADILYDPRFLIVGEWRELAELENMWRHDAVVESLFTWMEDENYRLDPVWATKATIDVGLAVRRMPWIGSSLKELVHPHADRQFLVAGLALQQAGEYLLNAFNAGQKDTDHLSYDQMKTRLNAIRDADLEVWKKKPRRAGMHRWLHPPKKG